MYTNTYNAILIIFIEMHLRNQTRYVSRMDGRHISTRNLFWTSSRNTFIPSFYVCLQDNKYLFTASKLLYSAIFTAYQNISIMQFPRIKNEYIQILHNLCTICKVQYQKKQYVSFFYIDIQQLGMYINSSFHNSKIININVFLFLKVPIL